MKKIQISTCTKIREGNLEDFEEFGDKAKVHAVEKPEIVRGDSP